MSDSLSLKNWLAVSPLRGSVRQLAHLVGVPTKTAEDWVYGRYKPGVRNKARLFLLTGLQQFEPTSHSERRMLAVEAEKLQTAVKLRIGELTESLQSLETHLEFFKNASPDLRGVLRANLNGRRIGYITNLLQMMMNEEKFQTWLEMSQVSAPLQERPS